MNQVQKLEHWLRTYIPDAKLSLDAPENANGSWFLDVKLKGHGASVEWRPRQGFGISANPDVGYGEGPDEVFPDFDSALRRLLAILVLREQTQPPASVRLKELRQLRDISQEELAAKLKKKQAAISKVESRQNVQLDTLEEFVRAMGGELSIRVKFADGVERTLEFKKWDEGFS